MNLSKRIDQPELMDSMTVPSSVMRETLRFLRATNIYFGGIHVVLRHLKKWSRHWVKGEPVELLDVGTGGAEIPMALMDWAKKEGHNLSITAVDTMPEIVTIAAGNSAEYPEISLQCKDFFDLQKETKKFDYVIASLFLHHIAHEKSIQVLQSFDSLAKRGVIISDLERSKGGYWAVKSLSSLIGNEIVKHDGPLSVRRAFRIDELQKLAHEAGLPYLQAQKESWFRVSLTGEKQ